MKAEKDDPEFLAKMHLDMADGHLTELLTVEWPIQRRALSVTDTYVPSIWMPTTVLTIFCQQKPGHNIRTTTIS
jgi:hypothetical protein